MWLVRFTPDEGKKFYRLFVSWRMLVASMSAKPRHPSWETPMNVYYINTDEILVRDVTQVAIEVATMESQRFKPGEREPEVQYGED